MSGSCLSVCGCVWDIMLKKALFLWVQEVLRAVKMVLKRLKQQPKQELKQEPKQELKREPKQELK